MIFPERIRVILNEWKLDCQAIPSALGTEGAPVTVAQYPLIQECLRRPSVKALVALQEWIAIEYFQGKPHKRETAIYTHLPSHLQAHVDPDKPAEVYNVVGEAHELYWLIEDLKNDQREAGDGCSRCCYTPTRQAQIWEDCEYCGTEPIYV